MCILMRPLWEVVSGQRRDPLAHLLLNQQHLHGRRAHTHTQNTHETRAPPAPRVRRRWGPTSVALPWLRACSVKLQLLWMCSFPWRSAESWACRTCAPVDEEREEEEGGQRSGGRGGWGGVGGVRGQICEIQPAFCLVVQMFSRSVMRAVLR